MQRNQTKVSLLQGQVHSQEQGLDVHFNDVPETSVVQHCPGSIASLRAQLEGLHVGDLGMRLRSPAAELTLGCYCQVKGLPAPAPDAH